MLEICIWFSFSIKISGSGCNILFKLILTKSSKNLYVLHAIYHIISSRELDYITSSYMIFIYLQFMHFKHRWIWWLWKTFNQFEFSLRYRRFIQLKVFAIFPWFKDVLYKIEIYIINGSTTWMIRELGKTKSILCAYSGVLCLE